MYRHSPSRNQRSKRIRVKHVLQICLLLAVCFWLIYQVKHSHDKKKEFDESDAKASLHRGDNDEYIKLGRKDVRPRVDETISKNEKHDETTIEEEDTTGEEIEIKHEEDESEDKKVENEADEHEHDKSDAEDDIVDEEKEREDGDENENQETDTENDDQNPIEKESSEEEMDRDGDDKSTHEAREENYKADDASSAVAHENEGEHVESSKERPENILEEENKEDNAEKANKNEVNKENDAEEAKKNEENKEDNTEEAHKNEGKKDLELEVVRDSNQSNATTTEAKENVLDKSENVSSPNNTMAGGSDGLLTSNSTTEETLVNHDLPEENVTESESKLKHGSGYVSEGASLNSTLTVDSNSSINTESPESNESTVSEASLGAGNKTESSTEKNEEESEKSQMNEEDEISEAKISENPEEVEHDAIDISDSTDDLEEKDVRTDLDTLPDIHKEGTIGDDAAAE